MGKTVQLQLCTVEHVLSDIRWGSRSMLDYGGCQITKNRNVCFFSSKTPNAHWFIENSGLRRFHCNYVNCYLLGHFVSSEQSGCSLTLLTFTSLSVSWHCMYISTNWYTPHRAVQLSGSNVKLRDELDQARSTTSRLNEEVLRLSAELNAARQRLDAKEREWEERLKVRTYMCTGGGGGSCAPHVCLTCTGQYQHKVSD